MSRSAAIIFSCYGVSSSSLTSSFVLIHYYQNAVVATTLRYPDEVREPSHFAELKDLPEAGEEDLSMMTRLWTR
jgi:non-homologous end joining protein Ku